ncbi:procathepsin L-like [Erpetoichthys calabaricus]|uniref:Cathepsin L.1 n=1 Tax=Erpetoichthys calabaricus TaxID=27687 RepID=A0A8C4T5Z9_ERPCA|nr:procathepsin L-like [Erpetoichthys calabaricus]
MKCLIIIVTLVGAVTAASLLLEDLEFYAWMLKHGKSYRSNEEEVHRKEIWLANRKYVLLHNMEADQGIKSYRLGMNFFADLTNQEYRQITFRGCLGRFNSTKVRQISTLLWQREGNFLPTSVDWRNQGYVTDVKNQKDCGSCWAFSATGALEGQQFRKTGTLVSLSEQQLVDCSGRYGNYGCGGGLMNQSFQYIEENGGVDTEESYPYEARDGACRFNPNTIGATCSGYVAIPSGNEKALQTAVATVGPVSVAIDAGHISFQFYMSGIYNEPQCSSENLDHAVLAVGYGTKNNQDYWLVKNSWGLSWGQDGYILMARNENNQCGIATAASYPLI